MCDTLGFPLLTFLLMQSWSFVFQTKIAIFHMLRSDTSISYPSHSPPITCVNQVVGGVDGGWWGSGTASKWIPGFQILAMMICATSDSYVLLRWNLHQMSIKFSIHETYHYMTSPPPRSCQLNVQKTHSYVSVVSQFIPNFSSFHTITWITA